MAGKRQAASDLNHDNWDREDEPEERGTFRTATDEELKNRVIKKAKRKIVPGIGSDTADGTSGTKNVFSGFSGFGNTSVTAAPVLSSQFSFLSKIPAVAAAPSDGSTTTGEMTTYSFGTGTAAATTTSRETEISKTKFSFASSVANTACSNIKQPPTAKENSGLSEYHKKLSSLNQAVCNWIKSHVDQNPVCILSPIFKDYEKYLEKIGNEKESTEAAVAEKSSATGMENFKFSVNSSASNSGTTPATSETEAKTNGYNSELKKLDDTSAFKPSTNLGLSFGVNSSMTSSTKATSATTSSSFSFGYPSNCNNQSTTPTKSFSFTPSGTPFSFSNVKPPDMQANTISGGDINEDDEEPPKNEFKQVVEENAIYSKKCKVFVKKNGNFVDKGIGTLYLKPVASSDKTQLLVRADTNLGNILVNLILNSAIPCQRMGKNNVMLVCLPTPDVEKPTSMLLRVKTSEEADELLENIEKYKK